MSRLRVSGNSPPRILRATCHNFTCVISSKTAAKNANIFCRQARIRDGNAATRATVVSAIRYTFADTTQSYDELLAPLLMDFLSLMVDTDLVRLNNIYERYCPLIII